MCVKFRIIATQMSKTMLQTFTFEIPQLFEFNDKVSFNFNRARIKRQNKKLKMLQEQLQDSHPTPLFDDIHVI